MPQLKWDETQFIECLETLPSVEEYEVSHLFEIKKDGLLLELIVWQYESVVQFAIFHDKVEGAVIQMALFVKGEVRYIKDKKSEFLEFRDCICAPSRFSYLDFPQNPFNQREYAYDLTMWLFVKPHIKIHFVR